MDAKHTPKPWSIDDEGQVYHRPNPLTKIVIAEMQSGKPADENLILAAPEMFEALQAAKELAKVAETLTSCGSDDEWVWGIQAKIDAALFKAEGSEAKATLEVKVE